MLASKDTWCHALPRIGSQTGVGADVRLRNQRQEPCRSRVNVGYRPLGTKVVAPLGIREHSGNLGLPLTQP